MKIISHITFAAITVILFLIAVKYESDIQGDLEWSLYYGALFALSGLTYLITKSWKIVIVIAVLVPFSSMGKFVLVSATLSLITCILGILSFVSLEKIYIKLGAK